MTIGEWIKDRFGLLGYPYSESLELELCKDDLLPTANFTEEAQETLEVRLISLIPYLMAAPKSVSESGFSVTRQELANFYKFLLKKWGDKYGLSDTYGILNTIEDVTDVW